MKYLLLLFAFTSSIALAAPKTIYFKTPPLSLPSYCEAEFQQYNNKSVSGYFTIDYDALDHEKATYEAFRKVYYTRYQNPILNLHATVGNLEQSFNRDITSSMTNIIDWGDRHFHYSFSAKPTNNDPHTLSLNFSNNYGQARQCLDNTVIPSWVLDINPIGGDVSVNIGTTFQAPGYISYCHITMNQANFHFSTNPI